MSLMEYKGYHARIEYDADDQIFIGSVVGIRDSLCFHGYSVDELTRNFEQSIENYFELCKSLGKSPDKEYKGKLNIRLTPALHKKAAIISASEHISINQFISEAVSEKCSRIEHQV